MAGKAQRIQSRSSVNTGPDMALREFKFSFSSQDRSFSVNGKVDGSKLVVTSAAGKSRTIDLTGPVFPAAALGRMVATANLKKDSLFKVPVFDVSVLDVIPTEIHVLGRERIKIGDKDYDAIKFTMKMAKMQMTTWVDANGLSLREESPPSMVAERTDPGKVLETVPDDSRLDILTVFRVPVDTSISEPEDVVRLKLELSGVSAKDYDFVGPNQKVVSESPLVLEITTPPVPGEPVPLPVKDEDEFLKPSVTIQSDAPAIKAKATEALGKVGDAVEAARKLTSWVFTVVEKEATASFPSALDVLKHMKGDCNEHSVFYAALARSVGIPAKVAVGLVYMNGAFYYHAWNEVYLGKWVPVDATFGEFPASAVHVKLAEGELSKQAEILGLVGKVKVRVLEFSRAAR